MNDIVLKSFSFVGGGAIGAAIIAGIAISVKKIFNNTAPLIIVYTSPLPVLTCAIIATKIA
jgi:hypothetical protein